MWLSGGELLLIFLFFLFINTGAIVGAFLGFLGKRIGYYLCLLSISWNGKKSRNLVSYDKFLKLMTGLRNAKLNKKIKLNHI